MKHCEKHGVYNDHETMIFGSTFIAMCPQCEREQEASEERTMEMMAVGMAHIEQFRKFEKQNIEPAFYEATFDNFQTSTKELEYNLSRVQALVAGEIKKIVMVGTHGTGKTHLACAAIHALDGKIMSMYEISATIRASYAHPESEDELAIVNRYSKLPLFVIDEIGRTKGSDSEMNWLSYIIDKRHVRELPTILISNKHVRKTCDRGGCYDCLENYIGEDIMSRLSENGILLKFTGDDWRKSVRSRLT